VVCGLVRPSAGKITFDGRDTTKLRPKAVADRGIVRSFQTPTVFAGLPVEVNVELGARRPGAPSAGVAERVDRMLDEVALMPRRKERASVLSHGEKKRLELAMLLAGEPRVLLLDEPTAGMSIRETDEVVELLRRLGRRMTVVVIEHDMSFVRQIADRVSVLHRGALLTEGSLEEVKADERVKDIYLGSAID
jgi:urea transport system ATP-binding protein